MSPRIVVELEKGRNLLIGGDGSRAGLSEVGIGADFKRVASEQLNSAVSSLADFILILERGIQNVAPKPDKIEFEFGASFTNDCNLWIVSGEAKAEIKVKVTWGGK